MNDLPRREPTPLYAETGRFERTLRRARRRRARAAGMTMVAVLAICTGGAMALVTTQSHDTRQTAEVPQTVPASLTTASSATTVGPSGRPSAHRTSASHPSRSGHKGGASHQPGPGTNGPSGQGGGSTGTEPSDGESASHHGGTGSGTSSGDGKTYRGQAVDQSGKPLADVGVYVVPEGGAPQRVTETGQDGSFEAPCDQPVLLAAKDLGPATGGSNASEAGYTFVDGSDRDSAPDCTAAPMIAKKTVLPAAGDISLEVTDPAGDPVTNSTEPELYCDAVSTEPCYQPLTDGDGHYTFTNLTPGDYTLRSGDASKSYSVAAGRTTEVKWVVPDSTPTAPPSSSPPSEAPVTTDSTGSTGTSATEVPAS